MSSADAKYSIQRVAVLGAGTMGSRIAAHIANAGFPVLLLDIVPSGESERNLLAARSLETLKKSKPPAFVDPALASHITIGNFEDDLEKLKTCDWIIEAVTENLAIKRALLSKVAPHLGTDAILTTNTSGLPVAIDREGDAGNLSPALVWDAFLQSAALYASGGDHCYA